MTLVSLRTSVGILVGVSFAAFLAIPVTTLSPDQELA